jgi:CO/xanthine dehydrogenase Mo-binding subunit
VNPEATRAQFEGAIVHGTSIVRTGEITATNGAINQSNFQDYPVARINQVPGETNVYIVDSDEPPAGVGEPGVPPFVAAFCNAVYAATGKKVRNLPITNYGLS